jgi:hypothetical protein
MALVKESRKVATFELFTTNYEDDDYRELAAILEEPECAPKEDGTLIGDIDALLGGFCLRTYSPDHHRPLSQLGVWEVQEALLFAARKVVFTQEELDGKSLRLAWLDGKGDPFLQSFGSTHKPEELVARFVSELDHLVAETGGL